jgi:hypothetical protein
MRPLSRWDVFESNCSNQRGQCVGLASPKLEELNPEAVLVAPANNRGKTARAEHPREPDLDLHASPVAMTPAAFDEHAADADVRARS